MTDKWGSLTRKIPTEPEEEELDERDMFDLTAKLKLGEGLGRLTFDGGGLDPDQDYDGCSYESFGGNGYTYPSATDVTSVMSIPPDDLKVKFDVIGNRVVQEGKKKYVLYTIIVTEVPGLDTDQAIIERRYSDFLNLHKRLKKECHAAIKSADFPKKELFGNYDNALLEARSRKFEKYLCYIFHQQGICRAPSFKEFFYIPHLVRAAACLRSEDYDESYEQYLLGWQLQKKLQDTTNEIAITVCGLIEVLRMQKRLIDAEQYATQALDLFTFDLNNRYLLPLIRATIDLRNKLKIDYSWLQQKLRDCEARTPFDPDSPVTLRELAVKRF